MRSRLSLTVFSIALFAASPANAIDEVVRKSEATSVRGTIQSISKAEVTVGAAGRETTVPVTDIAAVRWDGEPPQLNLTRARESNGDVEFALTSYREILKQIPSDRRNLKIDLEFLIARTLARQAIADPAKKDAAIKALNDFANAHGDFFRYFEALQWLGRVHTTAGEYESAQSAYSRMSDAPLPELKMGAQNALGRIKLEQDDTEGALTDFDAVLATQADSPAAISEKSSAQLGRAIVLQRRGDHEGALKSLDEVVQKASPNDSRVQAEAFVRKGESLRTSGRDKDAILAYLHVDILFPGEAGPHAEALYYLSQLWPAIGKAERSAEARRKLMDKYPESEWAKKL